MKRLLLPLLAVVAVLSPLPAGAADNFSEAERALFTSNHLATLKPPTTLRYGFRKSGSLEAGFDDKVSLALTAQADGGCCAAQVTFLDGPRQLSLPDLQSAQGNPVILYFLERDVREMNRLTKGQAAYFRKRIRMAIYQGASVEQVSVPWRGKEIAARRITVSPYLDDPLRPRFEKYAAKRYVFTLADAVPGGVYALSSHIAGAAGEPLLHEELLLDGASPRVDLNDLKARR